MMQLDRENNLERLHFADDTTLCFEFKRLWYNKTAFAPFGLLRSSISAVTRAHTTHAPYSVKSIISLS